MIVLLAKIKIGQYDINYWPEIDLLSQISVVFKMYIYFMELF